MNSSSMSVCPLTRAPNSSPCPRLIQNPSLEPLPPLNPEPLTRAPTPNPCPASPPTTPTKKSPRESSRGDFTVPDDGFEPTKAMPTDLQSAPFGRSGNLACTLKRCEWNATHYSVIYTNRQVERIFSYPDSPLSRAQPRGELTSEQCSPLGSSRRWSSIHYPTRSTV